MTGLLHNLFGLPRLRPCMPTMAHMEPMFHAKPLSAEGQLPMGGDAGC